MTNLIMKRRLEAKKNKKKGFTLIELIVVIVIIAIIAAIAVPALTRYIESANNRAAQATAHNIQVVLQAEVTDYFEEIINPALANTGAGANGTVPLFTPLPTGYAADIYTMLANNGIYIEPPKSTLSAIKFDGRKLESFTYTAENGTIVVKYANGKFELNP